MPRARNTKTPVKKIQQPSSSSSSLSSLSSEESSRSRSPSPQRPAVEAPSPNTSQLKANEKKAKKAAADAQRDEDEERVKALKKRIQEIDALTSGLDERRKKAKDTMDLLKKDYADSEVDAPLSPRAINDDEKKRALLKKRLGAAKIVLDELKKEHRRQLEELKQEQKKQIDEATRVRNEAFDALDSMPAAPSAIGRRAPYALTDEWKEASCQRKEANSSLKTLWAEKRTLRLELWILRNPNRDPHLHAPQDLRKQLKAL